MALASELDSLDESLELVEVESLLELDVELDSEELELDSEELELESDEPLELELELQS
jgi:hypothetical protein